MYDRIVLSGDWHISNRKDASRVSHWLNEHINPKRDALILMGDLIDVGLDRGMSWDQESVNKQLIYLKKLLEPYKILGYVLGNHERRIHRKTGINPYQLIYGDETFHYLIDDVVTIAIEHGKSAARDQTLELLRLQQTYPEADVVALGHSHALGIHALPHGVIGLRTGHLQEFPDYARRSIMVPKPMGCIRYYPEHHKFELVM